MTEQPRNISEPTISCPNCNSSIKLNESLAAPLIAATQEDYDGRLVQSNAAIAAKEDVLKRERADIDAAKQAIDNDVAEKLQIQRGRIEAEEVRKAKLLVSADLQERDKKLAALEATLQARDEKLAEAQQQQAEFLKQQRALDDERREISLTVEKRVNEGLDLVRAKAKTEVRTACG